MCQGRRLFAGVRHFGNLSVAATLVGVSKEIVSAPNGILPGAYILLVPTVNQLASGGWYKATESCHSR